MELDGFKILAILGEVFNSDCDTTEINKLVNELEKCLAGVSKDIAKVAIVALLEKYADEFAEEEAADYGADMLLHIMESLSGQRIGCLEIEQVSDPMYG